MTPHTYLNYKRKLNDMMGAVMGPNMLGEYVIVVEQTYDEKTKKTRLGLRFDV